MRSRKGCFLSLAILLVGGAIVTFPVWGWGPAYYVDMERTVLSSQPAPDGNRAGYVEKVVVGGVPTIVVIVRDWWTPNFYLTGCVAASHYGEVAASVDWTSNDALTIQTNGEERYWSDQTAPFRDENCRDVAVTIEPAQT